MTPRRAIALVTVALTGTVAAAAAVTTPGAPPLEPAGFRLAGDAQRGKAGYLKRCALCHGDSGDGGGTLAPGLDPKPTAFSTPGLLAKRTDWELYLAVRDGGQAIGLAPTMSGWGKLVSDQEVRDMTAYVRSLAPAP